MVIGDHRNFISAIVVPQADVVKAWAAENGIEGDVESLCRNSKIHDHFRQVMDVKMEKFSRYEQIKKFTLVPDGFSQDAGDLTPTLKLKRRILLAKYAEVIDQCMREPARIKRPRCAPELH